MPALALLAHGSHRNPNSSAPAHGHADRIRATDAVDEVRAGFWKEEPHLREVLRTLASDEVFAVPLFVSEGYFTEAVIPRELRLEDWDPDLWESDGLSAGHATCRASDTGQTVHYTGPVGTHDAMTDVIVRRAETVTGDPGVGPGVGLAVVGHGTERNAHSARAIRYHTDRIRERDRFDEVRALFMDEEPAVDDLTTHFESERLVLVPLFVADGYHTQEDIPADVGLTGGPGAGYDVPATVDGHEVWYAGAVGTEPLVAAVVLERAADAGAPVAAAIEALRDATTPTTPGPGGGGHRVTGDAMDAIDALIDEVDAAGTEGVAVEGLHVVKDDGAYLLSTPERSDDGASDGWPSDERLSEAGIRSALGAHPTYVREWYYWTEVVPDVPRASEFLRWLESADHTPPPARLGAIESGVSRTWGQLRLTVWPGDGSRRAYEVRHVDDAELPLESLERHADPVAVRDIAQYDADGNYRPLATAPTLRRGWAFVDLGPEELLDVVDRCYPATVANWYRERTGELDVTHWRETAERQTGIYDLVDELEGEAVSALARACCVDGQCLKRREWDEYGPSGGPANDGTLDAPRGEGEFPCREPCSLVVAAAREFVRTEREATRSVSVDLRPRELSQLNRLVDAVADGELVGVAPGDLPDPANPLRVRYLRERRRTRDSPLASSGGETGTVPDEDDEDDADGEEAE
jgi:sirohydrochlorin cobaltochelatase